MTLNEISIIVGFVIIVLTVGANWGTIKWVTRKCESCKINELAADVARIDERTRSQADFSQSLLRHLADSIRQNTEPRRDLLIDKLERNIIDLAELEELATLLRNRVVEGGLEVCNMSEVTFRTLLDVVQIKMRAAQGKEAGHVAGH